MLLVVYITVIITFSQANVAPIQKGPPSSSVVNYQLIFVTSAMSKVFVRLVSVRLGWFMERRGVLSTTPSCLSKRSGYLWCTIWYLSHTLKMHWRVGRRLGSWRLILEWQRSFQSTISAFYISSALWVFKFCVVNIDTVSIKPIKARYGGWLSE